jgi:hypothetical protein
MSKIDHDDDEPKGFFQSPGFVLGAVIVAAGLIGLGAYKMLSKGTGGSSKSSQVAMVRIVMPPMPPPPPPPPPPPQQVQEAPKMIEQQPDDNTEKPPDNPPDAPPDLSGGVTANGVDMGLTGGRGPGGNGIGGTGPRSKFGWYGNQVKAKIAEVLRNNRKTRAAKFPDVQVRVWPDASTGRITRVALSGSTGDPAVDEVLRNSLPGTQLNEPPPPGMPSPIVLRLNARRPN